MNGTAKVARKLLAANRPLTVSEIAHDSHLPVKQVYACVNNLCDTGAIVAIGEIGTARKFAASGIDRLRRHAKLKPKRPPSEQPAPFRTHRPEFGPLADAFAGFTYVLQAEQWRLSKAKLYRLNDPAKA